MYQCDELITNTRKFIHANFASVAEMDEFLNLEAKEVERWITSDEISVAVEADVFKILLRWIEQDKSERKASFKQLFRHVRLAFLSRDFLWGVVTNELVEENFDCYKLISKAIKMSGFSSEDDSPQSPRQGLETRAIVACGGNYTLCYLPEKDEWKRLADGLTKRDEYTRMINYSDQLFVFSSGVGAERYDPVFDCWSTLDHLQLPSEDPAKVAVVRGEIYSIEIDTSSKQSTIKRFDVERCSWQTVFSSHEGCREYSCVVAAGNHLYVCGGFLKGHYVARAERFDTVENKWEEIANMQQARNRACGVTTEEKIFVAGGRDVGSISVLKTCEMYNISTNEWQFIGSLNVPREDCRMMCLKGTLYVLGGTDARYQRELSVECYDPTEDKWIEKTTIPVKMISQDSEDKFTGCVLKLSKAILDKLEVIKN